MYFVKKPVLLEPITLLRPNFVGCPHDMVQHFGIWWVRVWKQSCLGKCLCASPSVHIYILYSLESGWFLCCLRLPEARRGSFPSVSQHAHRLYYAYMLAEFWHLTRVHSIHASMTFIQAWAFSLACALAALQSDVCCCWAWTMTCIRIKVWVFACAHHGWAQLFRTRRFHE